LIKHSEDVLKKFVLLHCGFEKPTPEMMQAWGQWFESVAHCTVDNIGFAGGREISHDGVRELGWDSDAITGCSIIEAESLDAAQALAATNPFIKSIRIYEVREHGSC
jgi:hypothetical protein